ncbi:MAG: DUF2520 domain-containing protein [Marinicaulis sp.]|nr:DUF2520 domain-containing protein [Marinicaulis sp.]
MRYVIFGAGRAGANIEAYLRHLGHGVDVILRRTALMDKGTCRGLIATADIVAAAIPDGAIPAWYEEWSDEIGERCAIHFSGAASVEGMAAYHPLFSFPRSVIDMAAFEAIGFACSQNAPAFGDIFPNAPNPNFVVNDKDRAFYHALAVVTGNLPAYLWNKSTPEIERFAGADVAKIMSVYLQSLIDRFQESPSDSLTGPVARRDAATVSSNLSALETNPELRALYETFLRVAWPDFPG